MLGYVIYTKDNGCKVMDGVKYIKEFKDEVQIYGELHTYFIDKDSCTVLKDSTEEEVKWFYYEYYKGYKGFRKGEKNDFVESN